MYKKNSYTTEICVTLKQSLLKYKCKHNYGDFLGSSFLVFFENNQIKRKGKASKFILKALEPVTANSIQSFFKGSLKNKFNIIPRNYLFLQST